MLLQVATHHWSKNTEYNTKYVLCPNCRAVLGLIDELEKWSDLEHKQCDACGQKMTVIRRVVYHVQPYTSGER